MPSYTRGKKREALTFVAVNTKILYGFKTKDLASIGGVSSSDLTALGHLTATAANAQSGKILVVGAGAPKPPRVTKKLPNAAAGTQGSVSTFCANSALSTALAAGWSLAKQGRGVMLKAASSSRATLTVIATLSNGAKYAFPMNKADFDQYGSQLGLESSAAITTTAEKDSLVRGSTVPRPGKASIELADGSVFSTFFSTTANLATVGFSELSEEVVLNTSGGQGG